MKQVFFQKGGEGLGRGIQNEEWESRYQHDSTKLAMFPVVAERDEELEGYGRELDRLGGERAGDGAYGVVEACAGGGAEALRAGLVERRARDLGRLWRMCGLQEELDWVCYERYGLVAGAHTLPASAVTPLAPGLRPFELTLAADDAERRAALERGEEIDQQPSAWFERHGLEPGTADALDPAWAARVAHRLALTAASDALTLLEQTTYKRRWHMPDHAAQEREALATWLMDRLEAWARARGAAAWRVREAAAQLEADGAVRAVASVLAGRDDFDLGELLAALAAQQAVPHNKHHVFKPSGLEKRARWEQTWAAQHAQDRGEEVSAEVPPRYTGADYLQTSFWQLRGKLDVPRERFIAWTHAPHADPEAPLYSWAGLTPLHRAMVLMELEDQAERAGHALDQRQPLLRDVWTLLPWVAWESTDAADEYRDIIASLVGQQGPADVPPPKVTAAKKKKKSAP